MRTAQISELTKQTAERERANEFMWRAAGPGLKSRRGTVALLAAGVASVAGLVANRRANAQAGAPAPKSGMVSTVAIARAKPGQEDELGRRMMALVAPTLAEPGCINYDLHRSNTDPAVWMFYENWRSQADLDAHMQSPHFKAFFSRADEVMASVDAHQLSMVLAPGQPYRRC
jgi:quinol monooxygenase YgiN